MAGGPVRLMWGLLAGFACSAVLMPAGLSAEPMPGHLSQLTRQLMDSSAEGLKAARVGADAAHLKSLDGGLSLLKEAKVATWTGKALDLAKPYGRVAGLLGLDPSDVKSFAAIEALTHVVGEPLKEMIENELGQQSTPEKVDEVVRAVESLKSGDGLATEHVLDFGEGERLEVEWSPEKAELVVRALKEMNGADDFELSLSGATVMEMDPTTGNPLLGAEADADLPPRALTAREIEDRKASILGTWENEEYVWQISASSEVAGEVRRSAQAIRKEIDALRSEITEMQRSVEYIWEDSDSGEVIRQEKFRRLESPWVYKGEKSLVTDVDKEVADREKQISKLEAEARGEDRPMVERLDPIAFERVKASPAARPLQIAVSTKGTACDFQFQEAYFDGRRLVARRTHDAICTLNKGLPQKIMSDLIASWAPPEWLLMRADYSADGKLSLKGANWGLRVSYNPDEMQILKIFDPYASEQIAFVDGGGKSFVALGAAETMWP